MKRIALLTAFLSFGGMLFAQQKSDSCVISAPTKLTREGCGEQQIHLAFKSSCPVSQVEITIYNRWGSVLYTSGQLDHFWQVKEKNPGTYYYQIKGTFSNGNQIDQNGFFQLL
jgi:hypothetical protein